MPLNTMDIYRQVEQEVTNFLNQNPLSFAELKSLILSKKAIPAVHQNLDKQLSDMKNAEQDKIKTDTTGDIELKNSVIENLYTSLIKEAEQINFSVFIRQLKKHLKTRALSDPETSALWEVLRYMELHLASQKGTTKIQEQLDKIKTMKFNLSTDLTKVIDTIECPALLRRLNSKFRELESSSNALTTANVQLRNKKIELSSSFDDYLDRSDNLMEKGMFAFIPFVILVFTFGLIIMPIMTAGVFIPPAWFIPLVLTTMIITFLPPMFCFIGSLGCHILAGVQSHSYHLVETTIKNNVNQMVQNSHEMESLKIPTMRTLKEEIETLKIADDELSKALNESQKQEEETLNQAINVKPVLSSSNTVYFFSKEKKVNVVPPVSPSKNEQPTSDSHDERTNTPLL